MLRWPTQNELDGIFGRSCDTYCFVWVFFLNLQKPVVSDISLYEFSMSVIVCVSEPVFVSGDFT